jgi:hypothetical protein
LLDGEILLDELDLLDERNIASRIGAEHGVQQLAQQLDHARRCRVVAVAHQHADGVEAVEEKVRIELHAQRTESRLGELCRQSR